MLYDQYGREIPPQQYEKPISGRSLIVDVTDRIYLDVARNLTPAKVDRILSNASHGDVEEQAELSELILEKNHVIADSFDIRCKAVLGLPWHVEEGQDTPAGKKAAEDFEKALRSAGRGGTDSFRSLLADMLKSLIVGYSVHEIIWGNGGELIGFASVQTRFIDFLHSYEPRIRLSDGSTMELLPNKFIYAQTRLHGPDPCRGGYIRPLAWLFCFMQLGMKDLLSFIERYGMPFVLAKVSDETFQHERNQLLQLIRKFGSGGGGLVTHGTDVQFVQAGNSAGDIYFELQKFFDDAVHRLLQGQTASSGDGGGLSGDNAQAKVRQDILEADASYLSDVINQYLAIPWTAFNCPPGTALPRLVFDAAPPENKEKLAATVKTLYESGFEADPVEMSEHFGIKLTRRQIDPPERTLSDLSDRSDRSDNLSPGAVKWIGPLAGKLEKLSKATEPGEFGSLLHELAYDDELFGPSEAFEQELEGSMYDAFCAGALAEDQTLDRKLKGKK